MGMNDLLLASDLKPEQRRHAETVKDSAAALLTILNDILDISKLEAGRVELEAVEFDPAQLVERTIALMAPRARDKRLGLDARVDPALRGQFTGDPTRFRQVLLNLLGNAIKFTAAGEVSVTLAVDGEDADGLDVRVEVVDSGIGIERNVLPALFQ
jgi:signal transduction histidine kinase